MRALVAISVAFSVPHLACSDDAGGSDPCTEVIYEPQAMDPNTFPDNYFTVDDPTTPTGLRVQMRAGIDVALPEDVAAWGAIFDQISTLDGFGTTGDITLMFDGPIDATSLPAPGDGSGRPDASVVLIDLDASPPAYIDFEWRLVQEAPFDVRTTLVLMPTGPLRPQTRYGVAVTTRARAEDGGCIAPSQTMASLIEGTNPDPGFARTQSNVQELVGHLIAEGVIADAGELAAGVVFTTQSTVETSVSIANQIRQNAFTYQSLGPCQDLPNYYLCEGEFVADDFRAAGVVNDDNPGPESSYTLGVASFLPKAGPGPFPTTIFGHGLNGDRFQAEELAELSAPLGMATVAINAVKHGDHPDQPESPILIVDFFGMSISFDPPLDGLKLRDNLRQCTYDKLQLLELLRPGIDVDGDGVVDLNHDQLGYIGVSLGGIMSAAFLALAPEVQYGVIVVPGAKMGSVIVNSPVFGDIITLFRGTATDGMVARFFAVLQTAVDRGDPGAYAPWITPNRLPGFDSAAPQVLMQMVIGDQIVPNAANAFFAQALGLPHLGDELLHMPNVTHEPNLPVSNNVAPGITGGSFQYDLVFDGNPDLVPATHNNIGRDPVSLEQSMHFIDTWLMTGQAEIIDPYRTLGLK